MNDATRKPDRLASQSWLRRALVFGAALLVLFTAFFFYMLRDGEPGAGGGDRVRPPAEAARAGSPRSVPTDDAGAAKAPDDPVASGEAPAATTEPAADSGAVVGRVADSAGAPIAGARVEAREANFDEGEFPLPSLEVPRASTSGADGAFRIEVPTATAFRLAAEHPDFAPGGAAGVVFAGDRRDIVLSRGAVLTVSVVGSDATRGGSHGPLAGALVQAEVRAESGARPFFSAEGRTGADGSLRVPRVPRGVVAVRADVAGLVDGFARVPSSGTGEIACEVRCEPGATVKGVVTDAATTLPIAGATVGGDGVGFTTTDEEGKFVLSPVGEAAGMRAIGASATGYSPEYDYVTVSDPSDHPTVNLALARGVTVRGIVVDGTGVGVAGASVGITTRFATHPFTGERQTKSATTGDDGRFEIDSLRAGATYFVLARRDGGGRAALSAGPFDAARSPVDLDPLVLVEDGSISGTVVGLRPKASWAWLRLGRLGAEDRPETSAPERTTRTDAAGGNFLFERLAAGKYRLEVIVAKPGSEKRTGDAVLTKVVALAPGESLRDLVLDVAGPGDDAVAGRVIDPFGNALPRLRVALRTVGSVEGDIVLATDRAGAFRFDLGADRPGPFRLEVSDPKSLFESAVLEPVTSGDTRLEVTVQPLESARTVRGRLVLETGEPVSDAFVAFVDLETGERLHRVAIPEKDGRFEMRSLRETTYRLEILDFAQKYAPARIEGVKPLGEEVAFRLVPRP